MSEPIRPTICVTSLKRPLKVYGRLKVKYFVTKNVKLKFFRNLLMFTKKWIWKLTFRRFDQC